MAVLRSTGMNFIGIDVGTSAVKAVLVEDGQQVVARASVALAALRSPQPNWFEQDPADWWRATEAAVGELRQASGAAFAGVRGIGLSGQMHGAILLDVEHRPLRPAILWNDGRATAECAALTELVPGIATIAGVQPMPGFTAPKLLWLKRHEPDVFAKAAHILLAKDFVRLRMTGEVATDMVDAAGTLLLDEARRDWSDAILNAVGIGRGQLPRLLEGPLPSGTLRDAVAAAWGLPNGVIVAAGGGDVAAGAVGAGIVTAGQAMISLGTSAQIFVARDSYRAPPGPTIHAFAHAVPDRWFEMAALLNGASALDWAARLFATDPATLLARAGATGATLSAVTFLPYLAGERTPLNDPDARGAFANLDYANNRDDLALAVLDGVAMSLAVGMETLAGATGDAPIPMVGGGGRSRFWMQRIASALGRPLARLGGADEGPAFGAARLARMAVTGEAVATVATPAHVSEVIDPDAALHRAYRERLVRFGALTSALRRVRDATADRRPAATR